jgi:hypothetical protein
MVGDLRGGDDARGCGAAGRSFRGGFLESEPRRLAANIARLPELLRAEQPDANVNPCRLAQDHSAEAAATPAMTAIKACETATAAWKQT